MLRYVVLLCGVSLMNCKMVELKVCVEVFGYFNVKMLFFSGNVVFDIVCKISEVVLEKKLEVVM